MVERAKKAGYRIEGVYIGTESPEINAERIHHRVDTNTGHVIDVDTLPQRYRSSLSNLQKTAEQFDALEIVDNSEHNAKRIPQPADQLVLESGRVTSRAKSLKPWCETWLVRFEKSLANRQKELDKEPTDTTNDRPRGKTRDAMTTHPEELTRDPTVAGANRRAPQTGTAPAKSQDKGYER
jgi:hypothetical protein